MTRQEPPTHRESIGKTIALRAGPGADAGAIALATLVLWQRIATQLEPVIGARGVDALFGRALHLAGKAHPCLAPDGLRGSSAAALEQVQQQLSAQGDELAREASLSLLAGFSDLLASLVGDSLTERLLRPAWEPTPKNENHEEHAP
jgi:hypothetical protein